MGEESFLERWIQPLSNLGILVLALATVAAGRPFTREYARESVPPEVQATAGFDYVNRLLTWVWIGAFAIMTAVSFIPDRAGGHHPRRRQHPVHRLLLGDPVLGARARRNRHGEVPRLARGEHRPAARPAERAPRTPAPPAAPVGEAHHGAPRLALSPLDASLDASLDVSLEGAPPGADVTLDAVAADAFGTPWRSDLTLSADGAGRVSADAAALLWSMEPVSEEPVGIFAPAAEPFALTVRAQAGDGVVECSAVRGAAPGCAASP